jgi:hypothetical protein
MSGDSAGGNLVAAMHVYMLQNNLSEFMADHLLFVSVSTSAPNASSLLTNQTECLSRFFTFPLQILGFHGVLHSNDPQPHTFPLRPHVALRNSLHVLVGISRPKRG